MTAAKLATAPADVNQADSQANQNAVTVSQEGNVITITGNINDLKSFASTNPSQGSGKWIGLDLNTGLETIVGATWGDNYTLTQDDVDEAASVGLGAGHIIFWTKAEDLPKTIKVNGESLTVEFAEETQTEP